MAQTAQQQDTLTWIASHNPLSVIDLADPVLDELGHDARSDYVEHYWLPVLGPSSIWAARRLVAWLETSPDGIEISLESLGRSLGLGGGTGRQSVTVRTLARLIDFGIGATGGSAYAIRRRFPPLPARHLERLPGYLIRSHDLAVEAAR